MLINTPLWVLGCLEFGLGSIRGGKDGKVYQLSCTLSPPTVYFSECSKSYSMYYVLHSSFIAVCIRKQVRVHLLLTQNEDLLFFVNGFNPILKMKDVFSCCFRITRRPVTSCLRWPSRLVFSAVYDGLCFSDHPDFTEPRRKEDEYRFQLFWIGLLLGSSLSHLRADWKFQKAIQVIPGYTRPNTCMLLCSHDKSYPRHGSPQAHTPCSGPCHR